MGSMTVSSNWVGEGNPLLRHSPDSDMLGLAGIIKVLHQRVDLGLFTMIMKIRAHWGDFLNKKADRRPDEGRDDVGNLQWDCPRSHPTFSWTEAGVENRCSMNKTLWARVHTKVAELQLPVRKNFTSEFVNQEDNSRDLLENHWQLEIIHDLPIGFLINNIIYLWQDKIVSHRSKRRLLQSVGYQFPCAELLKLWRLRENEECRLCKQLHTDVTPWLESFGHIQAQFLVLRKPKVTVHHGIRHELFTAISRNSL